jgi:hypothetical protein
LASGSVDCAPSLDPANFWIAATSRVSGARVLVEIDRNGRAVADPIPVADGTRLEAVTPLGFVIDSEDAGLQLFERGDGSPKPIAGLSGDWEVVGVHDSTIVVQRRLFELAIVDLRHGTILAVERAGEGAWGSHAAFSPDGTTIAIDARPDPPPLPRPFAEAIGAESPLERARLAFIDVASGATTVCRGEFAVHSYMPVWSRDGRWIVFASPFEKRQIWLVARDDPELRRVSFRRQPPMPMLDLSDQ